MRVLVIETTFGNCRLIPDAKFIPPTIGATIPVNNYNCTVTKIICYPEQLPDEFKNIGFIPDAIVFVQPL